MKHLFTAMIIAGLHFFSSPPVWAEESAVGPAKPLLFANYYTWYTCEELAERYAKVVGQAHAAGKKMCLPVHPGHDNLKEGNPKLYEMPRRDGQTL